MTKMKNESNKAAPKAEKLASDSSAIVSSSDSKEWEASFANWYDHTCFSSNGKRPLKTCCYEGCSK